jgi:hypothetical protein
MSWTSLYPLNDGMESWAVEHIAPADDGRCEKAVFFGPDARERANRYQLAEYPRSVSDGVRVSDAGVGA